MTPSQKSLIISRISSRSAYPTDIRAYLGANLDAIIQAVEEGRPLDYGQRGLEVKGEMIRMGLITPNRQGFTTSEF